MGIIPLSAPSLLREAPACLPLLLALLCACMTSDFCSSMVDGTSPISSLLLSDLKPPAQQQMMCCQLYVPQRQQPAWMLQRRRVRRPPPQLTHVHTGAEEEKKAV